MENPNQNPYEKTYSSRRRNPTVSHTSPTAKASTKIASSPSGRVKTTAQKEKRQKLSSDVAQKEKRKVHSPSSSISLSATESDRSVEKQKKKKQKVGSSSATMPEQVLKWFATADQAKAFCEKYLTKSVSPLKYLNFEDLVKTNLDCVSLLDDQGLRNFLEFKGDVYPDLVKVFYCNLSFKNNLIKSKVKGSLIKVKISQFSEMFHFDKHGVDMLTDLQALEEIDKYSFYNTLLREGVAPRIGKEVLTTGPLTANDRLLHYFLTYVLLPRGSNHAVITDKDIVSLFTVKNRFLVSWPELIVEHMIKSRNFSSLPYGFQISHLLRLLGVDLTGEVVVSTKPHIAQIDRVYLGKLDLVWNIEKRAFDYAGSKEAEVRIKRTTEKMKPKPSVDFTEINDKITELQIQVDEVKTEVILMREQMIGLSDQMKNIEQLILSLHKPATEIFSEDPKAAEPDQMEADPVPVSEVPVDHIINTVIDAVSGLSKTSDDVA